MNSSYLIKDIWSVKASNSGASQRPRLSAGVYAIKNSALNSILIVFIMIALMCYTTRAVGSRRSDSLTKFVEQQMLDTSIPGVSFAIIEHGEVVEIGASGMSRPGHAVTAETPFQLGSISKSFTALAILQLYESGELSLSSPISRYLTEFSGATAGSITIQQLLNHTSGYSETQGNQSQTDLAMDRGALARRVARLADEIPAVPPGTRWEYSNANYEILGLLIERTSHKPYAAYIKQRILSPLEMRDSYVIGGSGHRDAAIGHRPWFGQKIPNARLLIGSGSAPQGGIVASSRDMARYMKMLLNQRSDLVSANTKALMMTPVGRAAPGYGMGWSVDPKRGLVSHSGANPGFEALVVMNLKAGKGVVVLTNAGSGFGFDQTDGLRYGVATRALVMSSQVEEHSWKQQVFAALFAVPFVFGLGIIRNWRRSTRRILPLPISVASIMRLMPMIAALGYGYLILYFFPTEAGAGIASILLFIPDLGQLLILNSVIAVLWGISSLWQHREPIRKT
jgi:CubicO group peptidase (beta-lactamase class C family)